MKLFGLNITRGQKKGPTIRLVGRPKLRAYYDAAATGRHHDNHFLYADNSDADRTISPELSTLRNRCRYEIRNNSYAKGITESKADFLVGTGPRLQLNTSNAGFNRKVEQLFMSWTKYCDMAGKLSFADILKLVGSKQQDDSGDGFIIMQQDNDAPGDKPRLRLSLVEPDRVNTPYSLGGASLTTGVAADGQLVDGIKIDKFGKPVQYYVQKKHPGSLVASMGMSIDDYDVVPAAVMIHLYRQDRPGQTRGVPWFTPAVPLFAQLRRFTLATIDAAETAACYSAVIKSNGQLETDDLESLETIDIERDSAMTLPQGWEMQQFKAEQPSTTYAEFKREILNEIGRCLGMPLNIATANSTQYNYASGRLDWQVFFRNIASTQKWIARNVCNRILEYWLAEAQLIPGYLPKIRSGELVIDETTVSWYWPGAEHVDPQKEAKAQEIRLSIGATTYAAEYARQGKDWELEFEQLQREQQKIAELGIKVGKSGAQQNEPAEKEDEEKNPEPDEDQANEDRNKRIAVIG